MMAFKITVAYKMMIDWTPYFICLATISSFGLLGWFVSLMRNNVTHVDSMWSLFFMIAALTCAHLTDSMILRTQIVIILVSVWALRLCLYLTWRNWGPHEDHRYVQIRQNNEPHFWFKSIYIIFGLQALLAWVISMSIFGAINSNAPINLFDYLGIFMVIVGFLWESIGDWQLMRFKSNPSNKGKVLNTGLWRYSRHPNYFGEFCIWWGLYLISIAAGAWWSLISPIFMTILLLKVSGVSLLESTIVERRPAYAEYIKNTNAFLPWFPKRMVN
jgi:steroid 5-alpha reductase family enzyme